MKEGTGTNAAETSGHRASLPSALRTGRRVVTCPRRRSTSRLSHGTHFVTDIQNGHSLLLGECCGFRCSPQRNESDRTLGEDLVRKLFECIGCNTTVALEGRDQ